MGFSDFARLFKRENRLLLILVLWLVSGVVVIQLEYYVIGGFLFLPLLMFCFVLFIASIIYRRKTTDILYLSKKNIFRYILIGVFVVFFFILMGLLFFVTFWLYLFTISIFSYVFLITVYYTVICYDGGVSLDDKLSKSAGTIGVILRWILFLGGIVGSVLLLWYLMGLALGYVITYGITLSPLEYAFLFNQVPLMMFWIIIGLSILAGLLILTGNLNSWLGIFYVTSVIYIFFLVFRALISLDTTVTPIPYYKLVVMLFDILMLLLTTATLIGKKAEKIDEKLRFINQETILLWFFFTKAVYEYSESLILPAPEILLLKTVGVFILFFPLMVIAGLYGIISYDKLKKKRKRVRKRKKTIKAKKKGR